MKEPTGILDQRNVIGGPGLREEQQAAERLQPVADAVARDEHARLGPLERLHGGPLDERVVDEQRAVAGQQDVAHERLDDVIRVQQGPGFRRDGQAARVRRKRLGLSTPLWILLNSARISTSR